MFSAERSAAERFYLQPAPEDPVLRDAAARRPHVNAATGTTLFHQSMMPVGQHAGKIMERMDAAYLLWVHTQDWMKTHRLWAPVWDYVDRHRAEIEARNVHSSNP